MDYATGGRRLPENYLTATTPAIGRLLAVRHETDGPDDAAIHAIHRGPSGYIPLAVKEHGREWRELGAVAVGQPFLPGLLAALAEDGYFGLNTSFRTGHRFTTQQRWTPIAGMAPAEERKTVSVRQQVNPVTGLPWQQHDSSTLRWLNVAYADLDCYKRGLSVGEAVGAIVDMQDRGIIPPATMLARSGRGVWAFWFLLDARNPAHGATIIHKQEHRPDTPQRASALAVRLYARIQRAIVSKLAHLGADLGAVDGPRYAPMPGTTKSNGDARVLYWTQATANGVPAYTLRTLAEGLDLELQAREHPIVEAAFAVDSTKNATKAAAGAKGWQQRWRYALQDMEVLIQLRGGTFNAPNVSRNTAALYYALTLTKLGMSAHDVDARVSALGHQSGLSPDEITAALGQARKRGQGKHLSSARVFQDLHVSDVERSYLRDRTPPAATQQAADIHERRIAIMAVVAENGGRVPSVRDMAAQLQALGVPCGNHTTVWRDYRALGYVTAGRAGRPARLPL